MGAALNAGSEEVAALVAREREFSANASHQLRTPLAALRLELEAAQLTAEPADTDAALAQVDRLEQTIATLLVHARGPGPARTATTDLAERVEALRERWHGRLAAAGRPLRIVVHTRPACGRITAAVLDEITDILVQNAVDHGAARSPSRSGRRGTRSPWRSLTKALDSGLTPRRCSPAGSAPGRGSGCPSPVPWRTQRERCCRSQTLVRDRG